MRLATLRDGGPDGTLIVVSADGARASDVEDYRTLQRVLDDWKNAEPILRAVAARLDAGLGAPLASERLTAPMPRAWQWLDGSAYRSHGELMERLFGTEPPPSGRPLMYQGLSHHFLGATDDVPLPREADGIDFEGEFGVITDFVPMGTSAADALPLIRLVLQINDWSLRAIAPIEMKTGFGWVQAKPACSIAPYAVSPDQLGDAWRDGRVCMPLRVTLNGTWFGEPEGTQMGFGFHELVAHAAATRDLCAGTIIGSGTVSNPDFREVGSTCIAERRAIEMLDTGKAETAFMRFGDCVRMEAILADGTSPFGVIDQRVVQSTGTRD